MHGRESFVERVRSFTVERAESFNVHGQSCSKGVSLLPEDSGRLHIVLLHLSQLCEGHPELGSEVLLSFFPGDRFDDAF